jgi:hypothetical protein
MVIQKVGKCRGLLSSSMNTFQIRPCSREEANLIPEFDPGNNLQEVGLKK